jgi:hypothetical protein
VAAVRQVVGYGLGGGVQVGEPWAPEHELKDPLCACRFYPRGYVHEHQRPASGTSLSPTAISAAANITQSRRMGKADHHALPRPPAPHQLKRVTGFG